MKKLIGRAAVWLSDKLKTVIIWGAGIRKDPHGWTRSKDGTVHPRYVVGGFASVPREFAAEAAEKCLKG